jgi:hypothetical protein
VSEHVPPAKSECFADGRKVAGVVLDAGCVRGRGRLGCAAAALIVENELALFGQRRERGPQEFVIEEQPPVHADERYRAGYLRREVDGELEAACTNNAP